MIEKIICGFQTGADRASADCAIALGIPYGGYVTKGKRSEDGKVPDKYTCTELDTWDYPTRTKRNIQESDATVLITIEGLTGGSKLTKSLAGSLKRPLLHLDMDKLGLNVAADKLKEFIDLNPSIEVLNVAGSRASKSEGFQELAFNVLMKALGTEKKVANDQIPKV